MIFEVLGALQSLDRVSELYQLKLQHVNAQLNGDETTIH